jgi:hypothetical protein
MVLNHSFTIEAYVKSAMEEADGEGALYASYQKPFSYTSVKPTIFNFNIRDKELVWRMFNDKVYIETNQEVVVKETW